MSPTLTNTQNRIICAGLLVIALNFSFPRFTETATYKETGHMAKVVELGRSFVFQTPQIYTSSDSNSYYLVYEIKVDWDMLAAEEACLISWTLFALWLARCPFRRKPT
jgi:hypothetical protein